MLVTPRVRVGGRAGRVQLGGVHETGGLGLADFFRLGAVGEVQDHQRFERAAGRAGSENPLAIAVGFGRIAHRWYQVGHDDGAAKGARDIRDGIGQHGTIAKMNVPVVGTQQGQAVGHEGIPGGSNSRECYRKRLLQALAIKFYGKLPISNRYAVNICVSVFLLQKPVEPPVRQRYLALLSVFASLPAMALTFQTRLESIEWTVDGDKFECRLTQPITDFGSGEFVRRAGEQATFRLNAYNAMMGGGSATLLAAAAPWQPGRGDINLGTVTDRQRQRAVQQLAGAGRTPDQRPDGRSQSRWSATPRAMAGYRKCVCCRSGSPRRLPIIRAAWPNCCRRTSIR